MQGKDRKDRKLKEQGKDRKLRGQGKDEKLKGWEGEDLKRIQTIATLHWVGLSPKSTRHHLFVSVVEYTTHETYHTSATSYNNIFLLNNGFISRSRVVTLK